MQSEEKVNVLLVDDYPENLLALEAILDKLGQNLVKAHSGEEALRCLLNQDFAVILLDVQMPGMDGFETAALIRQRQRSRHTPIIFLTAFSTSDSLVFKGYSLGAVDYLFKPIEAEILTSKVSVFVDLFKKTAEVKRQATQLTAINSELRESEERFRSLSACSPVGIFLMDITGRCTYMNPSCQYICGLTFAEGTGQCWSQAIHPEDRDRALSDWSACTRNGHAYSNELRFQTPQNLIRWVHVRSSPMLSDDGELIGHVGTLEDITERKQAEEDRAEFIREQEARRQAEAANRMKDEFLATLSHELRTPLNSILGWARLLRTRNFDINTTAKALETIERNAKLQAELIDDILDVSRIIRGQLRLNLCTVNLVSILEAALDAVRPTAEAKGIELTSIFDSSEEGWRWQTEEGEPLPSIPFPHSADNPESHLSVSEIPHPKFVIAGDPDRLQQITWNLLSNAIKFTPEGGKVEVKLSLEPFGKLSSRSRKQGSQEAAYLSSPTPHTYVAQIQVCDTGIGISKEFLPYVFDRFRQADGTTTRKHGGLGLGLAIVRHLVELHGGTVQAHSNGEGAGSIFTVQLPLLESRRQSSPAPMDQDCQEVEKPELPTYQLASEAHQTEGTHRDRAEPGLSTRPSAPLPFHSANLPEELSGNRESASLPLYPSTPLLSGLRVLLVDDEPDARELLAVVFKEHGVEVIAAGSATEAFQTLLQLPVDVLVSDIGLPNEDGYTLIRKVRNLSPEQGGQIPAVALTAYVREEDHQEAISAGFHMHIAKPVDTSQLLSAVAKLSGRTQQEGIENFQEAVND